MSLRALGLKVHYSKGHLSKIENDIVPASLELAGACDVALDAEGRLTAAFAADRMRQAPLAGTRIGAAGAPFDIPPPPSHFTGRESEVALVIDAIRVPEHSGRAPVVLIYGMPGVGKTALALQVAQAAGSLFPGGCLYVDFSAGGPARHDYLLRRLGVPPDEIPAEPAEARALYLAVLYRRSVLIVADGVTSSRQVAALVSASPACAVIATSRHQLPALDDCRALLVPPLAPAPAATLLRSVSGQADFGPDAEVRRIAAACGGLPLALRVAAVTARRTRCDAAELANLLEDVETIWPELDDGERSVYQELLADFETLPAGARRTVAVLALHPGQSVGRHPAAWLAGTSPQAVGADVSELLERDLITVDPDGGARLRVLPRRLAAGIAAGLDERSRHEALHRLVAGYARTAAAADAALVPLRFQPPEPDSKATVTGSSFDARAEAMAWCRAEADLVPRLCALALEQGLDEDCWRLAHAMRDYFFTVKAVEPWVASHRTALLATERCGDLWAQATTRNNLGMALVEQGRTDAADMQYRQALKLLRTLDDDRGVATTLGHQAWANYAAGRATVAIALAEQARRLNRRHDDRRALAIMNRTAALAYARTGQFHRAQALLGECGEILAELDLPLDVAMLLNCLGELHCAMGHFDQGRSWHVMAEERSAACGGTGEHARAVQGQVAAAQCAGR
jgi:tetratricopeptide (TPR) repeat protein